jgi:hypothetical protein
MNRLRRQAIFIRTCSSRTPYPQHSAQPKRRKLAFQKARRMGRISNREGGEDRSTTLGVISGPLRLVLDFWQGRGRVNLQTALHGLPRSWSTRSRGSGRDPRHHPPSPRRLHHPFRQLRPCSKVPRLRCPGVAGPRSHLPYGQCWERLQTALIRFRSRMRPSALTLVRDGKQAPANMIFDHGLVASRTF